jgi:hypothetical protein
MTDSKRLDRSPVRYRVVGPVSREVGLAKSRLWLLRLIGRRRAKREAQCLCCFDPVTGDDILHVFPRAI